MRRSTVLVVVALAIFFAAVAALGLWVGRLAGSRASGPTVPAAELAVPPAPGAPAAPARALVSVLPYRPATPLTTIGAFRLTDHEQNAVTEASLRGHYSLVFFGYTRCAQICAPTLGNLSMAMDELGTAAEAINVYFITVDPRRDTRQAMQEYVRGTNERIRGVTGTEEQVEAALAAFGAQRIVRSLGNEGNIDVFVEHTGVVFFLDREARPKQVFREGMPANEMAMAIRANW